MSGGGSAGRARGDEFAERVNAAADLLDDRVPAAEAALLLAGRFGCSARQAHRYVQRGSATAHDLVPSKEAFDTPLSRHLSTTNRGLLPGAPIPTRTGLAPAGLGQLAGRNIRAS